MTNDNSKNEKIKPEKQLTCEPENILAVSSNVDKAIEMTTRLMEAYSRNSSMNSTDFVDTVKKIYTFYIDNLNEEQQRRELKQIPAVAVAESITDNYIICLEDGKSFKSLRRHLQTHYSLSPQAYREKWGLPATYPMVAPSYAKKRSNLARQIGLGQKSSRNSQNKNKAS